MTNNSADILIERTQTLDAMLHQILNQALVAIAAEAGSLMLVSNKRGILQIKARLGKPRADRRTEPVYRIGDKSIASWVVQNKCSYLCSEVESDPLFMQSHSGKNFQSLLSVPIIHQDKVIAVLNADSVRKNYFNETHQAKLEDIAHLVAGSMSERISILDALAEVGIELTRLPREGGVEPVLAKITELALQSLGADLVILYQYVEENNEFLVEGLGPTVAGSILDQRPMRRKVYPGDAPWTVVNERRSGFYSNIRKHMFLTREVVRPGVEPRPRFVDREHIRSSAAILLPYRAAEIEDEEVVGVMFANYRMSHEFNIDEISALATFADYAAVAILNARREEQRRIEQIRMVESISANFAHRMGNLGGTGRVATQVLREHIDPKNNLLNRQLDRIEHEATVLLELAERLARPFKETGTLLQLTPIDITELVRQETELIRLSAQHIVVIPKFATGLQKVQSVDFQLRQVLHDILSNGIEALNDRDKGKLTIQTRFNSVTQRVEVEISDNGPGIPDDVRLRLFAPGVTTKKDKLGIGLWWCRTFMQATKGDVILKSTVIGEGTTFIIEIPCVTEPTSTVVEQASDNDKNPHILIVDDDREWREQLKDVVEDEGHSVEVVATYSKARALLLTGKFRLAVVDIRLGDPDPNNEDGLRLLADVDNLGLKTKVIIVTAFGRADHRRIAGRSKNLLAFINKRKFDLGEFRDSVRKALV